LKTFGSSYDFELHRLAFVQRFVPFRLNRWEVYEYVFPALTLNESITLAGIKPLHCSLLFHLTLAIYCLKHTTTETSDSWLQAYCRTLASSSSYNRKFLVRFVSRKAWVTASTPLRDKRGIKPLSSRHPKGWR